jgi:hypothetical protein
MTHEWTEADLQRYIDDGVEESLNLDYKAAGSLAKTEGKKAEITKDVSAFANSDGGVLIYGIAEFTVVGKEHLPEKLDPVNRREFSKEWLEQIINNIRPRLDGVVITAVQLRSGPDDVAYVVEVPQSTTAHQATDKRYYKRFNFMSVMMEDYEIRDVMARLQHPKIGLRLVLREFDRSHRHPNGTLIQRFKVFKLGITAHNSGPVYANYVSIDVTVPTIYLSPSSPEVLASRGLDLTAYPWKFENTIRDVLERRLNKDDVLGPARFAPILAGRSQHWEIALRQDLEDQRWDVPLLWTVYADNAPAVRGETSLGQLHREWFSEPQYPRV